MVCLCAVACGVYRLYAFYILDFSVCGGCVLSRRMDGLPIRHLQPGIWGGRGEGGTPIVQFVPFVFPQSIDFQ